jgi:hypothetical protein
LLFKTPEDREKFRSLLDENHSWPDYYHFRFIVVNENKQELLSLLFEHSVQEKDSRTGKYVSISTRALVNSSEEVISVYESVKKVKGIISL